MQLHTVSETCKGCGACTEICPQKVLAVEAKRACTVIERQGKCTRCGGCLAVCPNGALSLDGFGPEDLLSLDRSPTACEALRAIMRERRSVRLFKDKPVDRDLLEKVLDAASTAPMGFPPHTTEVLVLDRREELDALASVLRRDYAELAKAVRNPLLRQIVRLSAGAEDFHAIKTHVLEVAEDAAARFAKNGEDRFTYHAPALMLFHANRWGTSYWTNAVIVATYAMLAAQALGLGTTMLDIVAPIVNRSSELRQRWGIPKDNIAVVSLVLGHPKYRYPRGVRRKLKDVRFA